MRCLGFEPVASLRAGRRVRRGRFEERSSLPVSAACVVANGVRETLSALLRVPVALNLFEPVIPTRVAWKELLSGATVLRVRGSIAEAALVVRDADARVLVASAFGERADARALSAVEREVLARTLKALSGTLNVICGEGCEAAGFDSIDKPAGYATYFELSIALPAAIRLGIALVRDPMPEARGALRLDDLADVRLELDVRIGEAEISPREFLELRPGICVPLMRGAGASGAVRIGGRVVGRGECGARGGRYALMLCDDRITGGSV